ncbi:MAG: hypothetical protein CMJ72_09255 [Planctomycetaceae bacterium]|nr:hypothetical protein [Planctomycetaceae bacterium]
MSRFVLFAASAFVALPCCCLHGEQSSTEALIKVDAGRVHRVRQMMQRLPKPKQSGVDLKWHMDRAMDYATHVLDSSAYGRPLYANYVWGGPTRLEHSEWDVPHCVGRLLHTVNLWENSTDQRVENKKVIEQLRELLYQSISPKDHFAHFPKYCRENEEVDWHSQREVLFGLMCLYDRENDARAKQLAQELVAAYLEIVQQPNFSPNPQIHGRMLDAVMEYNRLVEDTHGDALAQILAEKFSTWCEAQQKFPEPAHNHSILGTIANVIEYGIETDQPQYVQSGQRMIDGPSKSVCSSFGHVAEGSTHRGEANCTGDIIRSLIMLGRNVDPSYLDEAEIAIRNHLLASQHLDASLERMPNRGEEAMITDAAIRCVGGFGFTLPNDLIDANYPHLAVDLVEGGMHALADVYDNIVSVDDAGIHVHFLFSYHHPAVKIRCFIPVEGLIEIHTRELLPISIRIPESVQRDSLQLQIDGQNQAIEISDSYLRIPAQAKSTMASIRFPLAKRRVTEKIYDKQFQQEWLGDTLRAMTPLGKNVPLYTPSRLKMYGR